MSSLACPLCSAELTTESLESHLRQELRYPSIACQLCALRFTSAAAAHEHFGGLLAAHPGLPPQLFRLDPEPQKEQRLLELVRLALGGAEAAQQRLCVCGRCRLLCREQGAEAATAEAKPRLKLHAPQGPPETAAAESPSPAAQPTPELKLSLAQLQAGLEASETAVGTEAANETCEEEPEQPSADVKPSLKDLQPSTGEDGRVECLLCGVRVIRDEFRRHAVRVHSSARPYTCLLCPQAEKSKGELAKHQKREHEAQLGPETFTFIGSEGEERELVERCFGAAKDVDYARLRCKPCDKLFKRSNAANHVAVNHLKKPLHACRLCDFASVRLDATRNHVTRAHKRDAGPDTIDSAAAQHYAPIIKGMVAQLFAKH